MISAFGVEHGEIAKSWTKFEAKTGSTVASALYGRKPDVRGGKWVAHRRDLGFLSSPKGGSIQEGSPAHKIKTEMKALGSAPKRANRVLP